MPNNNLNEPGNDLDMFEALAAQIFGGTFSIMQEVLQGGTGHIMIDDDQSAAGPPVWDDGSDFRRLAKIKHSNSQHISKNTDGNNEIHSDRISKPVRVDHNHTEQDSMPVVSTSQQQPLSILDLLFKTHPAFRSEGDAAIFGNSSDGGSGWSFSSSSARTTILPDGSEETVITKSVNGISETIRQVKKPDGSVVETVEPSKKQLDWTAPLRSIEDRVTKVWEVSKPELDQSMADLDRAASSIAKAYSGVRDGFFTRLSHTFTGDDSKNSEDRNPPSDK